MLIASQLTLYASDAVADESIFEWFARSAVFARIAVTSRGGELTAVATAALGTLALRAVVAVGTQSIVLTRIRVTKGEPVLAMLA